MIVALTGFKGSGKSTLATFLVTEYRFVRVPFAAPLKGMLMTFLCEQGCPFKVAHAMLDGDLKEEPSLYFNGRTPRHAMQTLGTEWGRVSIAQDLWTDTWVRRAVNLPHVVVDDCRFPSEAQVVQNLRGAIVRVTRPDIESNDPHPSEAEIKNIQHKYLIENDSSIFAAYSQMEAIINTEKFLQLEKKRDIDSD